MRRRTLLVTLGASVATVSGCVGERSPEVGLGKLGVMNRQQNSVSIHLTVEKRGEKVYDATHDFAGRTGDVVDGTTIIEEWMGDRTRYTVSVALTDGDLETTYSTADANSFVDDWGPISVSVSSSPLRRARSALPSARWRRVPRLPDATRWESTDSESAPQAAHLGGVNGGSFYMCAGGLCIGHR